MRDWHDSKKVISSMVGLPLLLLVIMMLTSRSNAFAPQILVPTRRQTTVHSSQPQKRSGKKKILSAQEQKLLFGSDIPAFANVVEGESDDDDYDDIDDDDYDEDDVRNLKLSPLETSSDSLTNELSLMRLRLQNCPSIWDELSNLCPDKLALFDEHLCDDTVEVTFQQMKQRVDATANLFAKWGVVKNTKVAVFGENSAHWLTIDHGIQRAGGVSAVRGADAPIDELRYIYRHCDSANIAVLQGPKLLQKIANDYANDNKKKDGNEGKLGLTNQFGPVKTIVLMHRQKATDEQIAEWEQEYQVKIYIFPDVLKNELENNDDNVVDLPQISKNDLATIVYTSGTTGRPKGVMLEHGNLLHQISHRLAPTKPRDETEPRPGDNMVSLLPVWHITERTFELWMLTRGCNVVYSSVRTFKADLQKHAPRWMVLVPRVLEKVALGVQDQFSKKSLPVRMLVNLFTRVGRMRARHGKIAKGIVVGNESPTMSERFESRLLTILLFPLDRLGNALVWNKVKQGFGGRLHTIIAGGSALAQSLESFYEICGISICVGYGLTECSPLLCFRRTDFNLVSAGNVGSPCAETLIRVVDPQGKMPNDNEERPRLPHGTAGLVLGRGPQVMRGYYKNPEATKESIDSFGWFDTGDLGRINPSTGELILTGRAKDTIVLSNGENIEPLPIEDAILTELSPLVEQVMLSTGPEGRRLEGICVLSPNELASNGYVTSEEAGPLQEAYEAINDPKCSSKKAQQASQLLQEATKRLRQNEDLAKDLMDSVKDATRDFRSWEQVGKLHITLEPFGMVNGQLTQSYKVKRNVVAERYRRELSSEK